MQPVQGYMLGILALQPGYVAFNVGSLAQHCKRADKATHQQQHCKPIGPRVEEVGFSQHVGLPCLQSAYVLLAVSGESLNVLSSSVALCHIDLEGLRG